MGREWVVKSPLKRTLHLSVQGFDKRQLAAFTIPSHLGNLIETLTRMHKSIRMRMYIVASYILA